MKIQKLLLAAVFLSSTYSLAQTAGRTRTNEATAPGMTATAELIDTKGQSVGKARITETPNGLLVHVEAKGLSAGPHGFHIHEVGKCDTPDFKTAGGHLNPMKRQHGFEDPKGPHAGDMANVIVGADGMARTEVFLQGMRLTEGKMALLDSDGAAIVIHAKPDDYQTDPAGDAGDRMVCGVIKR